MLFIYNTPQIVKFWMLNTYIPLDIIFIDNRNIISSIKEGIPMKKQLISSEINIVAVLEIPKGCAKKLKIKKGESVFWIKKKEKEIKNIRYFHCLNSKEKQNEMGRLFWENLLKNINQKILTSAVN